MHRAPTPPFLLCIVVAEFLSFVAGSRAEFILVPPATPLSSGASFELVLHVNNPSTIAVTIAVPADVQFRLHAGTTVASARLFCPDGPLTTNLPPRRGFALRLRGTLPAGLAGDATLHLVELAANAITLVILPAPDEEPVTLPAAEPSRPRESHASTLEQQSSLLERIGRRFSVHEPMYFAVGWRGQVNAKFQISLKYRLVAEGTTFHGTTPWLDDLYLGYTQVSLWDLEAPSAPFIDTSYKPSLFYHLDTFQRRPDWLSRLGVQGGFEHESNGQGGDDSRSLTTVFLRPLVRFDLSDTWYVELRPKFYIYLELVDNPDLPDYRGYFDFETRVGAVDGFLVSTMFRVGADGDHAAVQVDASYPFNRMFDWFREPDHRRLSDHGVGGYLMFQYFNGWGETLRYYDRKFDTQFRIGFMLAR